MPLYKNKKIKTICCVAGRSAGHIVPGLTRVRQLLEKEAGQEVVFFSTDSSLDKKIANGFPFISHHIPLHFEGTPQGSIKRYPRFLWQLFVSSAQAIFWLIKKRPHTIVSTGGYISIPVCLAGRLLGIRVELFELNALPGRAIRFLAPFVSVLYVCFEETKALFKNRPCILTDYPVRFNEENKKVSPEKILSILNLSPSKKTIFVLGGSQGSHFINKTIQKLFTEEPSFKDSFQLIHQTGKEDNSDFIQFYKENNIQAYVFGFYAYPEKLYPAADVVICRAGAGTLFETLFFSKRCIVIPLETTSTDHQLNNAYAFQKQYPQSVSVLRQQEFSTSCTPLIKELKSYLASTL